MQIEDKLVEWWIEKLRDLKVSYATFIDRLWNRRCPACEHFLEELEQRSGVYPCPANPSHRPLEFRKGDADFFCHQCRTSVWSWRFARRYCRTCERPLDEEALLNKAKMTLARFSSSQVPGP